MKRRVIPVTHLATKIAIRDKSASSLFHEGLTSSSDGPPNSDLRNRSPAFSKN
jgi:hypothetical protein